MAKDIPSVTEHSHLRGVTVLLRSSLNVPIENGVVLDTFRLRAAVKTIEYVKSSGARVIVLGHIGREETATLQPVHESLSALTDISWAGGLVGEDVAERIKNLKDGEAILLENVRSDPREVANDISLAEELAAHADIYVNDAFADSHREHTSIVGLPQLLPSYAGIQFIEEIAHLSRALTPETPAIALLGGAKFATKLPLIKKLLAHYETVFIGGALANDFFRTRGYEVGTSLVSEIDLANEGLTDDERIYIPQEIVIKSKVAKPADTVSPEESILDISPKSIRDFAPRLAAAQTILWNGPMGNYEEGFVEGTEELARVIAETDAYTVVGGGDTIAAIESLGLYEKFNFVSTAGGAMLIFLETGTLPGIEALQKKADV